MGQVNGLAVLDVGGYSFGRPSRITATVALGQAGVINIEREARLSGSTHDKGMMILERLLPSAFRPGAAGRDDREHRVRAVLLRDRRRQRQLDRTLRAALGAERRAAAPGPGRDRLGRPVRHGPGDRRRQRKDRRLLPRVQGDRPERHAGRAAAARQRRQPDARLRRRSRRSRTAASTFTRSTLSIRESRS